MKAFIPVLVLVSTVLGHGYVSHPIFFNFTKPVREANKHEQTDM